MSCVLRLIGVEAALNTSNLVTSSVLVHGMCFLPHLLATWGITATSILAGACRLRCASSCAGPRSMIYLVQSSLQSCEVHATFLQPRNLRLRKLVLFRPSEPHRRISRASPGPEHPERWCMEGRAETLGRLDWRLADGQEGQLL